MIFKIFKSKKTPEDIYQKALDCFYNDQTEDGNKYLRLSADNGYDEARFLYATRIIEDKINEPKSVAVDMLTLGSILSKRNSNSILIISSKKLHS